MEPAVIAAVVTGAFGFLGVTSTLGVQVWVQRRNASDHGSVREALKGLTAEIHTTRTTVSELRLDVAELKNTVGEQGARLEDLEYRDALLIPTARHDDEMQESFHE